MKCDICGSPLYVAHGETVKDKNGEYRKLTLVCINRTCENFSGKDLNKARKVKKIKKDKKS